ncbi:MAG TPA: hypothetical protein PK239_17280 [Chitinophagales bacterium]|nr:hypothetical protein [Chitinophagales bacterium]
MEHTFTSKIQEIAKKHFGDLFNDVFERSLLLQYLNHKTKSANKGSKSRGSFANLYAVYVLVEDYLKNKFDETGEYSKYEGAEYSKLFTRQRELPFGGKLQNHALNNRMKAEFKKFFPSSEFEPILRNLKTNRYWINENLLKVSIGKDCFNIAHALIEIIDAYVVTKQDAFQNFIKACEKLQDIENQQSEKVEEFILGLLAPNVDARLFEIVSFAILKNYYQEKVIFWGFATKPENFATVHKVNRDYLKLYKTGRTNANGGGIDFVMKPLGRFFQVTETLNFKKYFLDIDKIEKYPITFVVKSSESIENLLVKIRTNALKSYGIEAIVEEYMNCIEELISIPVLAQRFKEVERQGKLHEILAEIIKQSKVEFNFLEEEEENEE